MERLVLFLSRREIEQKVKSVAQRISGDYRDKDLIMVGILKGGFIFLADLVRELAFPVTVDFVRLAGYNEGTEPSGRIRVTKDVELDLSGRHVLIVDDIIDTGLTVRYLIDHLKRLKPLSVRVCVFIDNRARRAVEVAVDYAACVVKSGFLVGYGLDCGERHRTLPDIFEIVEDRNDQEKG